MLCASRAESLEAAKVWNGNRPAGRKNTDFMHRPVTPAALAPCCDTEAGIQTACILSPGRDDNASYALPVEPKPPAPRDEASKLSTLRNAACTTGTMTSCAMRSIGSMMKLVAPRFQQLTISGPW